MFTKTMPDGEQVSILVYVDDLLIKSRNRKYVDKVIKDLQVTYELTLHTDNVLSFLGITIDRRSDTV